MFIFPNSIPHRHGINWKIVLNFYKVFEFKKMSDTSEDISSESARIPYSERAEWSDIQPLNQEDGDVPVVKIAYSDKCKQIIH